ncbi:YerC/YecD family TrpR-related protein [Coriobacteriia bacterium Es71-Z0120]|jgi:TrpR-related protein YerC/YecD|uniref:YerC/YecD family TrpR-related protein n=1 Tax=Parvivirga hydrogeniphila TaxID=2939460 RepID=UPI002260D1DE|nr:YerC/YecD family TrpR-related protein [Parvivirga hydrogeniphila]MCL4078719.1 YerC/YecD family TrpR-related protein [Parvivirga hydrogeniphila]
MPSEPLRTPEVESLLAAFASLDSADDVYAFLLDVCTIREIQEMAQRLAVARMLAGGVHYPEIQRATGASPTTISRVSRCVNYGAGGYRRVIERLGTIEGTGEPS